MDAIPLSTSIIILYSVAGCTFGNEILSKVFSKVICDAFRNIKMSGCILMLTWTESDIYAPSCLLSGLRVRITADRKGWYTLLLEFPFFISLKLQMAVFKEVSFRSIKNAFVSLNTLTQQKGNVSETGYPQFFISTRYNQPAHRV